MRILMTATLLVAASLAVACAGEEDPGLCALSLDYEGRTYYPLKTAKRVQGAQPLADARFSCITNDAAGREDAKARFPAKSVDGIDPRVAFVVPSRWPRYVFYSGPSGAESFPPRVERLLIH